MHITVNMDMSRINSVAELRNLIRALEQVDLQSASIEDERYRFLEEDARKSRYASLRLTKKAKREVISFCVKVTGISRVQVKRLLCRFVKTGHVILQRTLLCSKGESFVEIVLCGDINYSNRSQSAKLFRYHSWIGKYSDLSKIQGRLFFS